MSKSTWLLTTALLCLPMAVSAYLQFGAEILIEDEGLAIEVLGYSVPDWFDWNGDTITDLIVGEGGGLYPGMVRVYLNQGSNQAPIFEGFFYVQSAAGGDLSYPGG
ncbi:hypothetical protein H8E52_06680 [bacterium]|nr:hypothetical protein [bacterium]